MSEIIRDAYERAIVEKYPMSYYMDTEHFEDSLREITDILNLNLEELLEEFTLEGNRDNKEIDEYLITWVIKKGLPNTPLYQKGLFLLTSIEDNFHFREKNYRLHLLSQKDNLKIQDPIWIWENKEDVDEFMDVDNIFYNKLRRIESIFPITVIRV